MSAKKSTKVAIARKYAKALFDLATEKKALEKVEADFGKLSEIFATVPLLSDILKNSALPKDKIHTAFSAATKVLKLNKVTDGFCALLGHNRRLSILPEVISEFHKLLAEDRGEVSAEVISAKALDKNQLKEIAAQLKKSTGKNVDITEVVDEEILGGLIIKLGSQMLDNSINGKLERLKLLQKQAALPS